MPKATFIRDFDYRTTRKAIVAYKAGWSGNVPQSHHAAAEAAGVLEAEPNGAEPVHP